MTSNEILSSLLAVDGALSNLDADLLDGQQGSYYLDYNNFTNTPIIPDNEAIDDRVAALLVAGSNITLTYDDVANTLTIASTGGGGGGGALNDLTDVVITAAVTGEVLRYNGTNWVDAVLSTTDVTEGSNLYYTDTRANSAIDTRVNKAFIDALNVDADTLDGIDSTGFATAAQGALADTALQPAAIGVTVQGYSAVLAGTTASFTTADETKLDNLNAFLPIEVEASSSYVALSTDAGKYKRMTSSSPVSFTINDGVFAAEDEIIIEQAGTGAITFIAGGAMVINSRGGAVTTAGQYGFASIKFITSSLAILGGDIQ